MAVRVVSYDTEGLPSGDRVVVLNGSDPIRFDSMDDIKNPISQNTQNIQSLEVDIEDLQLNHINQESKINAIDNKYETERTLILDNQARINNLEDRDLRREFLIGLDQASIRVPFESMTSIKAYYGRKEITNIIVYQQVSITPEEKVFEEITSGIQITYHEKYDINTNSLIEKYVLVETEVPITGYALIL